MAGQGMEGGPVHETLIPRPAEGYAAPHGSLLAPAGLCRSVDGAQVASLANPGLEHVDSLEATTVRDIPAPARAPNGCPIVWMTPRKIQC